MIAGGWRLEVGERLLSDGENDLAIEDNFTEIALRDLSFVDEVGFGAHPHRNRNGSNPSIALESPRYLTISDKKVNSMEEAFTELETIEARVHSHSQTAFDAAYDEFQTIQPFGPLSAFDSLELAIRVNGYRWLAPDQLKTKYVDRNAPGKTMRRIIENEFGKSLPVRSESGQDILDELVEFGTDELELSLEAAVFDIESCLCTFHAQANTGSGDLCSVSD